MRLDRDAALPLEVHGVENLVHHFALRQGPCVLEQAIGQRRLAVVDMRDDREISDILRGPCGMMRAELQYPICPTKISYLSISRTASPLSR